MKKIVRTNLTMANVWIFSIIADISMIGFVVAIQMLNTDIKYDKEITIFVLALAVIGLTYNLLLQRFLAKRNEFWAKYLQLLFPLLAIGIIAFYAGGVNSSWYLAFLFMLIICSILGYRALFIDFFIVVIFLTSDIFFNTFINSNGAPEFKAFPITLGALLCAWIVANSTEKIQKANKKAVEIGSELSSAQLSEKVMLSAMADPVISIDNQKRIILMNQASEELSGWDSGDAMGISYSKILNLRDQNGAAVDGDHDPFNISIEQAKTAKSDSLIMLRSKDNRKIALSISIAPTFNVDGKVSGAISVIRDISGQKEINREKSEFISTASHEMRTPVAAIEGFLSMAMNPKIATIDSRAKGYLEKAHESSIHLGKLFQDLLSTTKIEDQAVGNSRELFNICDVVLKTATELEPLAISKNLKLITHIGGSTLQNKKVIAPAYMVLADSERIAEVMTNLIDNAIKYSQKGGITIEILGSEDSVTISVEDEGVGISALEQKHIFEKFYRVNNSYTREQSGTGLGLYITRNIVELYGGKIWVESEFGKGSKFSFKLPLSKKVANQT